MKSNLGRVSLQARHLTQALPEDERVAVEVLEAHLWLRTRGPNPALEVLDDGTAAIFLTTRRIQRLLRLVGARKTGKDYAREITKEILPRLGLLQDTGLTKKPGGGGRHHQPAGPHSYWWPVYRVAPLTRLLTPKAGAYPRTPGNPEASSARRSVSASLLRMLICQGLISARLKRRRFGPGSVQAAFQATGPP